MPRAAGGGAHAARAGGRQHEAVAELREWERLVVRERAAMQAEERWLRGQRVQLAAEEQRVGASKQEVEAQRTAIAASERGARELQKAVIEAEARAQRERAQRAKQQRNTSDALHNALRSVPPHWARERCPPSSAERQHAACQCAASCATTPQARAARTATRCDARRYTTRQATVARAHAARRGGAAVNSGSPNPNRQGWGTAGVAMAEKKAVLLWV